MFLNSIDSNLQFTIEVCSWPTDSHLYLQADSCHHLPSILGIQKGVASGLRRICSTDEEFNNKSKE